MIFQIMVRIYINLLSVAFSQYLQMILCSLLPDVHTKNLSCDMILDVWMSSANIVGLSIG
jgi:hypothetical protein